MTRESDPTKLKSALAALEKYDTGSSRSALVPIDEAVGSSLAQEASVRADLERRLVALLQTGASSVAKEYVCSKLILIGSAISVPALAAVLADPRLGDTARRTLERLPAAEAASALRASLSKLSGVSQIGVINSLGARRDGPSVPALTELLSQADPLVAQAAAAALGSIGTPAAAQALKDHLDRFDASRGLAAADACLQCAERLLGAGDRASAETLYRAVIALRVPEYVRLAAKRGLQLATR